MPVIRIFALLFFTTFASAVFAKTTFQSENDLKTWMETYYKNPTPGKVSVALRFMDAHNILQNNHLPISIGFFTGVFAQHPQKTKSWLKLGKTLKRESFVVILVSAWHTNNKDYKTLIKKYINDDTILKERLSPVLNETVNHIMDLPLSGAYELNLFLYYFFATGDEKALQKMIAALAYKDQDYANHNILKSSLIKVATHHEKVFKFFAKEISNQPQNVAQELKEILEAAKNHPEFYAKTKSQADKTPAKDPTELQKKLFDHAQDFLKTHDINWGKPQRFVHFKHGCNLMEIKDEKPEVIRLSQCYFVFYPTPTDETELLGARSVVISVDFQKTGLAPRD